MLGATAVFQNCDPAAGEATLIIPAHLKAYANERIGEKIAQSLRAVLGCPMKLTLIPSEEAAPAAQGRAATRTAGPSAPSPYAAPTASHVPSQSAQRVPPEVIDAVRSAPLVRQLIERLGGDVTLVEMIEKTEESG